MNPSRSRAAGAATRLGRAVRSAAASCSLALLTALCAVIGSSARASATPGQLDPTFGEGGIVSSSLIGPGWHPLVLQPDEKIVVAGGVYSQENASYNFGLIRFNPNGTVDTTFGTNGLVNTPIGPRNDLPAAVAIQPDGRIVVGGYAESQSVVRQFAVARYEPDGSLDTSFGSGGKAITAIGAYDAESYDVAVQADGRIVLVGASKNQSGYEDVTLVRYTAIGALDPSFGTNGIVITSLGSDNDAALAVTLHADGNIVAAGYAHNGPRFDFMLARYTSDGSLDSAFDGDGIVMTSIGDHSVAADVVVQGNGKLLAAGFAQVPSWDSFALARYNTDGSLDVDFGTGGVVTTSFGPYVHSHAYAVALQPDGKIVAAGDNGGGPDGDIEVARYNADGSLDPTFSGDGLVTTSAGFGTDFARGLAVQADGKLVVAGWSSDAGKNLVLIRYLTVPTTGPGIRGDFNGDGFPDLAIAAPLEDVGAVADAGAVNVIYGSSSGLSATDNQLWTQYTNDILDKAEPGDLFGASLVVGDFNGDGFSDLAVGVPGEDLNNEITVDAGAVNVIYGSEFGLDPNANQFISQGTDGIGGGLDFGDVFGASLAAGDLNGDGIDDLAIGAPLDDPTQDKHAAGVVNVIYGSTAGLTSAGNQVWSQDSPDVKGSAQIDDEFGSALAIGDFNGNGYADLAIGVPFESGIDAGAVNVLYGSPSGVTANGNQLWTQDTTGILERREYGDVFGFALAAGSFEGNKYDDLVVGVPGESVSSRADAGGVNVIYGSSSRLRAYRNQFWSQDSTGIVDVAERGDLFGYSLTTGDFNGNNQDDLAVGVPLENVGLTANAGAAAVIYGSSSRLTATGDQLWTQNSSGVKDTAEKNDQFGFVLSAGNFDGTAFDDLAVGVDLENVGSVVDAGAANVIYGSSSRLRSLANQFWTQNSPDILDDAEAGDVFGGTLASGVSGAQALRNPLRRFDPVQNP